jgi:beta-lactamase class D
MRTILVVLAFASVANAAPVERAFVLYRVGAASADIENPTLASTPYLPCSTFKIPNTLIGLSTGVIPDEKFTLKWDGVRRDPDSWNRDHDLASAMRESVVWFYQEVARRIGAERMKKYLRLFAYGNQDSCCTIDRFWLNGNLRMTARQEVDFLRRMNAGELPVKPEHIALVKRLITLESTPEYTLQGKTGSGEQDGHRIGWLVGFVEKSEATWIYALLTVAQPGGEVPSRDARVDLAKKLLIERGVLPRSAARAPFHLD